MRSIRSILALFYCVVMVLLPYAHMPLHAGTDASHSCSEQHPCAAEPQPGPQDAPDEPHDCFLCSLTVLPADQPPAYYLPIVDFYAVFEIEDGSISYAFNVSLTPDARAPPFAAV